VPKADWETPPRSSQKTSALSGSSSTTCSSPVGGCETARVSSHTFIAQQVMGNNVHELTKVGVHVKCKAGQQNKAEAEHCFYKLVKILLAITKCK
jgi:hypothetical protein